jgi:anaerobic magnesium-protoporphyrin IX monomethyl ester cyclase
MMKITLIQPRVGHNPSYVHEPLNLGYIAAYLKENGCDDVGIHIGAFETDREIIRDASDADIVGFTTTSPMMKHAEELAMKVKENNSTAIIVFGGSHPSVLPENTLKNENIDVVVRGEGEITLLEIVQAIEGGASFKAITGVSYKHKGDILHNSNRQLIKEIDTIPFPARNLMCQDKFLEIGFKKYGDKGAWVFSSRGCPYHCTYCASCSIWTRKWRARSPENIIEEICELVDKYNVDRINFADDTFTISRKRVIEFCNLLIRENLQISWGCNVRVDNIDKKLFEIMNSAGCTDVWIGAESGSPIILKDIKKDITLNQIKNAFTWSKEAGLKRRAYLMIGSPKESKETILQTEKLIEEIRPDSLEFSILTPYPGCENYEKAKKEGYVSDDMDWSKVDLFSSECVLMNTHYLTKDEIKKEHERLSEKYKEYQRI